MRTISSCLRVAVLATVAALGIAIPAQACL
jgi:hypothetical protein